MMKNKYERKRRRAKRWLRRICVWTLLFAAAAGLLTAESLTWPGRINLYLRGNIDTNGYCMELNSKHFDPDDYNKELNLDEANLWFRNWNGNKTGKDLKDIARVAVGKTLYESINGKNDFASEDEYLEYCNKNTFEQQKIIINVSLHSTNSANVETLDDYIQYEMRKYLTERNINYNYYQAVNNLDVPIFIYKFTTDFPSIFRSTEKIDACEYETFLQCFAKARGITIDEYDIKSCARNLYICEKGDEVIITAKPENGWSKRHAFSRIDMYLNKDYCRYFTLRWKAEQELKNFMAGEKTNNKEQ